MLAVSPVVASVPCRFLLVAACVGSAVAALATIRMHQAGHWMAAYPARRVAAAGVLLSIAALSIALLVSSSA